MTDAVSRRRIESVDGLRGLVMVLMALDHTRDFFGAFGANPTDLATTTVPLFFTRWITHLCAPVFFLLTGTGAGLARGSRSARELSRFLVLRGLLLIALEVTVIRAVAYQFNVDYQVTMLLVIWALGWSMIVLGFLVFLPVPVIAAIGLALIAGHNLLDGVTWTNPVWSILHRPGFVRLEPPVVFAAYPLVPWVGVTAAGYALARVFTWDADRRRRFLLATALIAMAAFVALRAANAYGDPVPWSEQEQHLFTLLSFVNVTKYPPSLTFLLLTLGPALLLLSWFDREVTTSWRPLIIYGRTPLFYYVAHFALIHWLATLVCLVRYGSAHWMTQSPTLAQYPFTPPPGWGFPLPVVYTVWVLVVALMYVPCRRVAQLKASGDHPWLKYL